MELGGDTAAAFIHPLQQPQRFAEAFRGHKTLSYSVADLGLRSYSPSHLVYERSSSSTKSRREAVKPQPQEDVQPRYRRPAVATHATTAAACLCAAVGALARLQRRRRPALHFSLLTRHSSEQSTATADETVSDEEPPWSRYGLGDLNYGAVVYELEELIKRENCGPILMRLAWHDASTYTWKREFGSMRFTGSELCAHHANAGLGDVAISLLQPIADKYCPAVMSNADLWQLAANVSIRLMGGPYIQSYFGRLDSESPLEVEEEEVDKAQAYPDEASDADKLRAYYDKRGGIDDAYIVALSCAHSVGRCHPDRSGYDGAWTTEPYKLDNTYFKDLVNKEYTETELEDGRKYYRASDGTIMLPSDMALVKDEVFKVYVERYAEDLVECLLNFKTAWETVQFFSYPVTSKHFRRKFPGPSRRERREARLKWEEAKEKDAEEAAEAKEQVESKKED